MIKEKGNMAHKITDECISCGACQAVCPVEAIAEGDGKYEINADTCIDCGACAAQCPVSAIEA
jgi:ferredoxin